jgi:hypothetical protein
VSGDGEGGFELLPDCLFAAGGVLEGHFLDYSKVVALEKMPTKQELMRIVAILIKRVGHLPHLPLHPPSPFIWNG